MDLHAVLRELRIEKHRLDRIIQELESLERGASPVLMRPSGRRGRKSMSAEERRAVSAHMRKY